MSRQSDARALIYRLLATAFIYPADVNWRLFSNSFQSLLDQAAADLGLDIDAELEALNASWVQEPDDAFLHAHTELFLSSPRGILAPLNESVYFGDQPLVNTARTRQVAQAFEAAGFSPAPEYRDLLADHLSLELEFMAMGLLRGWDTRDFFLTHVYSWQPRAAQRVIEAGISDFYAAMALLLTKFLNSESRLLGEQQPSKPRQAASGKDEPD